MENEKIPNALTLSNIGRPKTEDGKIGAAEELFDHALQDVLANINDVNPDAEAKRTIGLQFVFVPQNDRTTVDVQIQVATKLAGVIKAQTRIYVGKNKGEFFAVEDDPKQMLLGLESPPAQI